MWKCEACGTQAIAGDLVGCPRCGAARNPVADRGVQVPAVDVELVAALAPVVPAAPVTAASEPVSAQAPASGPLAVPDTEPAHAETPETEAPSIPDAPVPDGT